MKRMMWFTESIGLDTEIDSVRHKYQEEKGVAAAKISYNIDYDKYGRISRRKGWEYTDVVSSCHSLFCGGGDCLFVSGDALTLLGGDYTVKELRNVTPNAPMSYQQVGPAVYYTNGTEKGAILAGRSFNWDKPDTNYAKDTTKVWSGPPAGNMLAYHNGVMYVIQQHIAWHSEAYNVNLFNLTGGFLSFESPVSVFEGVTAGIWVCTESKIVFLRGTTPGNFAYERKATYGAVKGTGCLVDCALIGDGSISGVGVMFVTKYGIALGTEKGEFIPITINRLRLPKVVSGSGIVTGGRYIATLADSSSESRLVVSMNLNMTGVSQYNNYNFNSFCLFGDWAVGASSSGLFKLDKTQRDVTSVTSNSPIESIYESGPTDFGVRTDKRIQSCAVGLESNGPLVMTVKADEGLGDKVVRDKIPFFEDNRQHVVSVPFGRDTKGRYHSFILNNVNGADFSIDYIEAFVVILNRKPEREGAN